MRISDWSSDVCSSDLKSTEPPNSQQLARMERELVILQTRIKSVEENYGIDNLHLTLVRGYVSKLLGNANVVRWLSSNRQEYLTEFQRIAEIETIAGAIGNAPCREGVCQ